jgi:glucose/mannose-6-phosphate isomerase
MRTRLERYEQFLTEEYRTAFVKSDEYSVEDITDQLRARMAAGEFRRIVFSGMGCSAIVSDVIRAYLGTFDSGLEVFVFNDYDYDFLVPRSVIEDPATLIILSSYSGHSNEPIRAFHEMKEMHDRVLLLTSGGRLAQLGAEFGVSIARWQLSKPDREYPLFHVGQYFAILVKMFHELGLISQDRTAEVHALVDQLATDFDEELLAAAADAARRAENANIIMVASPKWHESLLKLAKMHFNEIAMVPATRNFFHEFCHSEVATLSDPDRRHLVLVFCDDEEDDYTQQKRDNLVSLLQGPLPQNRNIEVVQVVLDQPTFMRKYFTALEFVQHVTLAVGKFHETQSRDLISEAAGNPWYHSTVVAAAG